MRGEWHHTDLTVSDVEAARPLYELFFLHMGYRETARHDDGTTEWSLGDGLFPSAGIKPARGENANAKHDRYAPGLHHAAWRAEDKADVDTLHAKLVAAGMTILDPPDHYYGKNYYAVFFADPDGLKLEYVWTPPPSEGAAETDAAESA